MKNLKKVLIVSETKFDKKLCKTYNDGTNFILQKYADIFDEVFVLLPGDGKTIGFEYFDNFIVFNGKGKTIISRILFYLKIFFCKKTIISLTSEFDHIQFRHPSFFVFIIQRLSVNQNLSIYLSGNWREAFGFNYPYLRFFGFLLDTLIIKSIKNEKVIAAGSKLSKWANEKGAKSISYISTTHTECMKIKKSKENLIISVVGSLTKLKGVLELFHLVNELDNKNIVYSINVIGDGPLKQNISLMSDKHNSIYLHGLLNRDKVYHILKKSHFLFHPSYSEGTPKVISEAMSVGCIPIARESVGSISDLFSEEDLSGINLDLYDYEKLTNKLISLFVNNQEYLALQRNVYRKCQINNLNTQLKNKWTHAAS